MTLAAIKKTLGLGKVHPEIQYFLDSANLSIAIPGTFIVMLVELFAFINTFFYTFKEGQDPIRWLLYHRSLYVFLFLAAAQLFAYAFYQGNRNLCGAPTAKMYTKPQLEIYTDDVMCSHGSAVGQLDEEALFYMRTRGIGLDEARRLLMQAFVADVIDGVRLDALKDRLHYLVEKRFAGTLSNCAGCLAACGKNEK